MILCFLLSWYKTKYVYGMRCKLFLCDPFVCLIVLYREVFSPFLFAAYLDGLLVELSKFVVHCY